MLKKAFLSLIISILFAGIILAFYLFSPKNVPGKYILEINPGDVFTDVSHSLKNAGIISDTAALIRFVDALGLDHKIQAGRYEFSGTVNIYNILYKIISGKVIAYKFTILEGDSISNIQEKMEENKKILKTNTLASDKYKMFCESTITSNEGIFYPDTYYFNRGSTDRDILYRAYKKMNNYFYKEWKKRDKELPYDNAYEALIMASIIEKEAKSLPERPVVGSVFINRLNKKMRLQADPTVIYGLGDQYTGTLTNKDLHTENEYNTYRMKGLPATPICCPSKHSIDAALHPKKTEYLFFVVASNGRHIFSNNFKQHLVAVNAYRGRVKYQKKVGIFLLDIAKVN